MVVADVIDRTRQQGVGARSREVRCTARQVYRLGRLLVMMFWLMRDEADVGLGQGNAVVAGVADLVTYDGMAGRVLAHDDAVATDRRGGTQR